MFHKILRVQKLFLKGKRNFNSVKEFFCEGKKRQPVTQEDALTVMNGQMGGRGGSF